MASGCWRITLRTRRFGQTYAVSSRTSDTVPPPSIRYSHTHLAPAMPSHAAAHSRTTSTPDVCAEADDDHTAMLSRTAAFTPEPS
ncbi:MAG: hypothetical protein ACTS22_03305 [Phycisphaerales bacterium]